MAPFVDGDGAQWRRFKICVDGGANAVGDGSDGHIGEFFLALCDDNRRAWLSEKWSRYRVPLLRAFDNALGGRREILNRKTIVVVGGGAWFSTPSQWILSPDKKHTLVTDELTSCTFEASCLPLPRLASGQPTLRGRLETVLKKTDQAERIADIVAIDRGDIDAVWIEQPHLVDENRGGSQREARVRLLFAANNHLTVVTTFTFRPEDARWAVAEWGRIFNSLTLTEPTAA